MDFKTGLKGFGMLAVIGLLGLYILPGGYEVFARMLLTFVATYKNTISLVIAALLSIVAILAIDWVTGRNEEGRKSIKFFPILAIILVIGLTSFTIASVWINA
jgi:hypothetical protein